MSVEQKTNRATSNKVAITKSAPSKNARSAKVQTSKKVPSKGAATKKAAAAKSVPSKKPGAKPPVRQKPEPQHPLQAHNDLQGAWERNVLEEARLMDQIQAMGGVDPAEDSQMMTELADLFSETARQSEELIAWNQAIIKAIKARPDAANLGPAIDVHKNEIAIKRMCIKNSRGCEKKLRRMLAKG